MSSSTSLTVTDGGNGYKAVQHKLMRLSRAMDESRNELEMLLVSMQLNADAAHTLASDIAHADLEVKFVEMTNAVSLALGGAAVQVRTLNEQAQEVSSGADETKRTHTNLYGALDEIRSGRPERTPKPGFFSH